MTPMMMVAALGGVVMAGHAWRTGGRRRALATVAALVAAAMLAILAWRPTHDIAGLAAVTINDDARLADVEAISMRLAPGARVTVTGDGLDTASLALLSRHRITWRAPEPERAIVALAWTHRAVLGERAIVDGVIGQRDSAWVVLEHPDGARDSVRTDSAFRFTLVPRAAGAWTWVVRHGRQADTIGMQVMPAPVPRVAWIEGRPNREASVLGALVVAQGGWMLQRTRLTVADVRVTTHGAAPDHRTLSADVLDNLDAVVIGPGGLAVLRPAERSMLRAAVDSGLGVVHLVDTVTPGGTVMPFATRAARDDERASVTFDDGAPLTLAVPIASVTLTGGEVLIRSAAGVPLAWRAPVGRGTVVATRLVQPSRWGLAGAPEAEAAWWSALLGATMRAPRAAWGVDDGALARVDHPIVVRRVGEAGDTAVVIEGGTTTSMALAPGADSTTKVARLWPRDTGWVMLAQHGDTLRLHVAASNAHPSLDRSSRRAATAAATARQPDTASRSAVPPWREPISLWWAWVLLIAALATLWARPTS